MIFYQDNIFSFISPFFLQSYILLNWLTHKGVLRKGEIILAILRKI